MFRFFSGVSPVMFLLYNVSFCVLFRVIQCFL